MANILVVCTANICRSPVAEALLLQHLHRLGYEDWTVGSAGTWAVVPRGAARNSIEVARNNGLDITDHQSRMITDELLAESDLVLCMEVGHAEALRAEFPDIADRVFLLAEMADQSYSVVDPYGGPYEDYARMYETLEGLVEEGLPRIVLLANENAAVGTA